MKVKGVFFLLVQIEEAHTARWPTGVIKLGTPHADQTDRRARAAAFASSELVGSEEFFKVVVDTWENAFADRYHAWPDRYVLLDKERKILAKSTYGSYNDAVIDVDCLELLHKLDA